MKVDVLVGLKVFSQAGKLASYAAAWLASWLSTRIFNRGFCGLRGGPRFGLDRRL
jgi:hypothetical protein